MEHEIVSKKGIKEARVRLHAHVPHDKKKVNIFIFSRSILMVQIMS